MLCVRWQTVGIPVCAISLVGCGGGGSSNRGPEVSTCGSAYYLEFDGRTTPANNCAGIIPTQPFRLAVPLGRQFAILVGHEQTGALDFPVPAPSGPGVKRLSRHDATVTYQAIRPGTTRLVAHHTEFCTRPDPKNSSCTVAIIHVTRS